MWKYGSKIVARCLFFQSINGIRKKLFLFCNFPGEQKFMLISIIDECDTNKLKTMLQAVFIELLTVVFFSEFKFNACIEIITYITIKKKNNTCSVSGIRVVLRCWDVEFYKWSKLNKKDLNASFVRKTEQLDVLYNIKQESIFLWSSSWPEPIG